MDEEMTSARDAVGAYLREQAAAPVMWESITPADRRAQDAYLDGVEQSKLLVLMLGSRYGRADATGYSPTHKEERRARELDIPRLLFERDGVRRSDRDGRLNDWIDSLYSEISGAKFGDSGELVRKLDRQLRELASMQDTYWVKLGPLVFPGSVSRRSSRDGGEFVIRASLGDPVVRRAVAGLADMRARVRADRLTWALQTHTISVSSVASHSVGTSLDDVEVTCDVTADRAYGGMFGGMSFSADGRSIGPAEQVELWAREALFGERSEGNRRPRHGGDILRAFVAHEGPTLPEVLGRYRAGGWLAEGLSRLFAIEEATAKFGGHFDRLEVGPSTASSIRFEGAYRLETHESDVAEISGRVPLAAGAL